MTVVGLEYAFARPTRKVRNCLGDATFARRSGEDAVAPIPDMSVKPAVPPLSIIVAVRPRPIV